MWTRCSGINRSRSAILEILNPCVCKDTVGKYSGREDTLTRMKCPVFQAKASPGFQTEWSRVIFCAKPAPMTTETEYKKCLSFHITWRESPRKVLQQHLSFFFLFDLCCHRYPETQRVMCSQSSLSWMSLLRGKTQGGGFSPFTRLETKILFKRKRHSTTSTNSFTNYSSFNGEFSLFL